MANGWGGRRPGSGPKKKNTAALPAPVTAAGPGEVDVRAVAMRAAVTDQQVRTRDAAEKKRTEELGTRTIDAFVNFGNNLGMGADNILSSSTASFVPLTRVRQVLEWMYRGQFICKNAVDVPADDMTREGVAIRGEIDPMDIQKIESEITQRGLWKAINQTIKWARLYGGCLAYMRIEGQDPASPLRIETVKNGQFKGLLVLDRWMVDPSLERLVTDPNSPSLGLPEFYRVTADAPALPKMLIHHTRVLRLDGMDLPYWQKLQENLWGLSVLETIQDRINGYDMATVGAAQLVNKAFIRTYKIKGLRETIAAGGDAAKGLTQFVDLMRRYQGIEGITLLDGDDEFEGHETQAFSGLASVVDVMAGQLSGALQIPITKLFGVSPAGFSTGDSDIRNYYDMIKGRQEADLSVPVTTMYKLTAQSLGIKLSEDFALEWRPLWQMTETERAQFASTVVESVTKAEEAGLISPQVAMKELKQASITSGIFTNITDEDIQAADDVAAPAPVPGAVDPETGEPLGPDTGGDEPPEGGGPPGGGGKPPGGDEPDDEDAKEDKAPPVAKGKPSFSDRVRARDAIGQMAEVHFDFHGLPIHIETQEGEERVSRDPANPFRVTMAADYGFIVGTGSAEGPNEGTDVFVGPRNDSTKAWAINQSKGGVFDEVKFMLGFGSLAEAIQAYLDSHDDPKVASNRMISVIECTVDDVAEFAFDPSMVTKPFGSQNIKVRDDRWITVGGPGTGKRAKAGERKGTPLLISGEGTVLGGAGGKLNGKKLERLKDPVSKGPPPGGAPGGAPGGKPREESTLERLARERKEMRLKREAAQGGKPPIVETPGANDPLEGQRKEAEAAAEANAREAAERERQAEENRRAHEAEVARKAAEKAESERLIAEAGRKFQEEQEAENARRREAAEKYAEERRQELAAEREKSKREAAEREARRQAAQGGAQTRVNARQQARMDRMREQGNKRIQDILKWQEGKVPGFQPQKTTKDAAKYAVSNGYADTADFGKLTPEVANAQLESMHRHLTKFPKLREIQHYAGSMQEFNRQMHANRVESYVDTLIKWNPELDDATLTKLAQDRVKKAQAPKGCWAWSAYQGATQRSGVSFNEKFGTAAARAELERGLKRSMETRFHPVGCDTIKSVMDHEYGHQIDNLLGITRRAGGLGGGQAAIPELEAIVKEASQGPGKTPKDNIEMNLSRYAASDRAEFVAEAWAEYNNNPNPRPIAVKVGKLIEKKYAEKFGNS
jgi:phage-related protein (TIGR01555 family)